MTVPIQTLRLSVLVNAHPCWTCVPCSRLIAMTHATGGFAKSQTSTVEVK
jgi:hypothetical protein